MPEASSASEEAESSQMHRHTSYIFRVSRGAGMSCVLAKKCTDCNINLFISQRSLPGVSLLQATVTIMSNISIVVLIMNSIQIDTVDGSSSRPGING